MYPSIFVTSNSQSLFIFILEKILLVNFVNITRDTVIQFSSLRFNVKYTISNDMIVASWVQHVNIYDAR